MKDSGPVPQSPMDNEETKLVPFVGLKEVSLRRRLESLNNRILMIENKLLKEFKKIKSADFTEYMAKYPVFNPHFWLQVEGGGGKGGKLAEEREELLLKIEDIEKRLNALCPRGSSNLDTVEGEQTYED